MAIDQRALRDAAEGLLSAELAVALTGAGVSTESGVPDFRSEGGIWEEFDERDFTINRFHADPEGFWADWLELKEGLLPEDVEPNPAHESLSALESGGFLDAVVTQNVDGLHQRAGSEHVIEVHGSGDRVDCRGCGASFDASVAERRAREHEGAPTCENCGDVLKPDAVLFGERLPDGPHRQAKRLAEDCDLLVVVGSSLTVEPVASLPERAVRTDATLVVVDTDPPATDLADHVLCGEAGRVVPELASAVVDARENEQAD